VSAVSEFQHRSVDREVMELALAENRIVLTGDKIRISADWYSPGVWIHRA